METFNFPGLQHILLQVFFSFSDFQKLERDVAEYITNFPHHTNKISQSNMSQSEKRPKKLTNLMVLCIALPLDSLLLHGVSAGPAFRPSRGRA